MSEHYHNNRNMDSALVQTVSAQTFWLKLPLLTVLRHEDVRESNTVLFISSSLVLVLQEGSEDEDG